MITICQICSIYIAGSNGGFNAGVNGGFNSGVNGGFNAGVNGGFNTGINGGYFPRGNGIKYCYCFTIIWNKRMDVFSSNNFLSFRLILHRCGAARIGKDEAKSMTTNKDRIIYLVKMIFMFLI